MIFCIFAVLTVLFCWRRHQRNSKLTPYMLEHFLKITDPVSLCGTPDVVWITGSGKLVVGDYKSREHFRQVFDSEMIQLSVYKLLLEKTQPKPVANYGFIHFKNRRKVKVKLMSERKVVKLYYRYWQVIDGKDRPCRTDNEHYCKYCSHNDRC